MKISWRWPQSFASAKNASYVTQVCFYGGGRISRIHAKARDYAREGIAGSDLLRLALLDPRALRLSLSPAGSSWPPAAAASHRQNRSRSVRFILGVALFQGVVSAGFTLLLRVSRGDHYPRRAVVVVRTAFGRFTRLQSFQPPLESVLVRCDLGLRGVRCVTTK